MYSCVSCAKVPGFCVFTLCMSTTAFLAWASSVLRIASEKSNTLGFSCSGFWRSCDEAGDMPAEKGMADERGARSSFDEEDDAESRWGKRVESSADLPDSYSPLAAMFLKCSSSCIVVSRSTF